MAAFLLKFDMNISYILSLLPLPGLNWTVCWQQCIWCETACSVISYPILWKAVKGTTKAASNFNVDDDVRRLHEAMKGFGTNEEPLIEILTGRSNDQRQQIRKKYKEKYKKVEKFSAIKLDTLKYIYIYTFFLGGGGREDKLANSFHFMF